MMRRKERKNRTNTMKHSEKEDDDDQRSLLYLPPHILHKIFSQVPKEHVAELRVACKWWNKLISESGFIAHDFSRSKSSLLIQVPHAILAKKSKLLELDDEGLGYKIKHFGMPRTAALFKSTCNGLILLDSPIWANKLLVVNMVTMCQVDVPRCPSGCSHVTCSSSLVFDPYLKQYKVVHICANPSGIEIFTLGSSEEKWKVIPGPIIQNNRLDDNSWAETVACLNGHFLHWDVFHDRLYILSMDTCEERTRETRLPHCYYVSFDKVRMSLFEMGGYLSLMYKFTTKHFDIWVLEDFQNQIWRKRFSILAESISYSPKDTRLKPNNFRDAALPNFQKLKPVCSLRDGEVILFKQIKSLRLYLFDIKLRKLKKVSDLEVKHYNILQYKSSLIYWNNDEELLTRETI